jgi:hypothetical protein
MMKVLKPIEIDASFLYRCPSETCGITHWLYLREVKTKNFKVVCYCGTVFKPKTITDIDINYTDKPQIAEPSKDNNASIEGNKSNISIPIDLLEKCVTILVQYGFKVQEAKDMLCKTYISNQIDNPIKLIELSLKSLEIKNV